METSVRLALLGIAFVIIAGIIWDAVRNRRGKLSLASSPSEREPDLLREDELLDEVLAVRATHQPEAMGSKAPLSVASAPLSTPVTVIDRTRMDLTGKRATITKTAYPMVKSKVVVKNLQHSQGAQAKEASPAVSSNADKNDLIVLHVMSKMPNTFNGKSLEFIFDELHLKLGEMNIYHSYEHIDGNGDIVFSIASAVEPGYFVTENLENFETPGLVLFFRRCYPDQSIAAFEHMYRTAKQIALRLQGEVLDETRKPITSLKIEQYRERVRNSER